jgi:hypothetical protein
MNDADLLTTKSAGYTNYIAILHCDFERRLQEVRLRAYPPVFADLKKLSHFPDRLYSRDDLMSLTEDVNSWGYGEAGLVMLPDTREAVFKMRDELRQLAGSASEPTKLTEEFRKRTRTDVAELMKRDLGLPESKWRPDLPLLLSRIKKIVDSSRSSKPAT